ncbi:MAG: heme exporter protein CcmD [Pseudomonadales bacterium]
MSFASPGEFFAMGGHGLYVWLSYGAAVIIVLYNVFAARHRQRRVIRLVGDRLRRQDAARRADAAPPQTVEATGESIRS